ncbi:MAG TPA: formate dehydrogenase accessory protein FdhE [Gammaproteobacteria bacterium]
MSTQPVSGIAAYGISEPPRVITPDPAQIFLRRAKRFENLAFNHPLSDWLFFLAKLTQAQHEALMQYPSVRLPDYLSLMKSHGMPPLPATSWQRDPVWRGGTLNTLLEVAEKNLPKSGLAQLHLLNEASPAQLEAMAERVLRCDCDSELAGVLPIVAAALQVYWTHMASALNIDDIPAHSDTPGVCPCCGSLPVASIVRTEGPVTGLRYLHCSLCNTEWNLVRVKCAACDSTRGIAYHRIEGKRDPISAETCDSCNSYLKIAYAAQHAEVDPVADDLATLSLDFLVDEAGYQRCGPNLLLMPGSAQS